MSFFRTIALLVVLALLSGCSANDTPTRHNDFTPLTSIEIVVVAPSIAGKTSTRLAAIGNFSGQFTRDITDQTVWSSNAPEVAGFITADDPGRVTGLTSGTARLTATYGSISAAVDLTVTPATISSLVITPTTPSLPKGTDKQFTVTGTFSDATVQDLTSDAAWSSSDSTVATISTETGSKGLARSLATGSTTITAGFDGMSTTTLLTVTEAELQSITVSPATATLVSQSTGSFRATGTYSDGSTVDITDQASWTASPSDIAEIAGSGSVKTFEPGTTSISAALNGISGKADLKVTGGILTGITISPAPPRLVKDTGLRIIATGTFSNGSSRDITGVVDWSLSNPSIANITRYAGNFALLHADAVTAATIPVSIKAETGQIRSETNLTVTAPQFRSITVTPSRLDLAAGTSSNLTATAVFQDGSTQDVSVDTNWTSDAETVALVDNTAPEKGAVKGLLAGNTTISAQYGGVTVTVPITVKTLSVSSLTISGAATATAGDLIDFTATATFIDGSTRDVTDQAVWSVDNTGIAAPFDSVNRPGQIMAVDAGIVEITADFGGKTDNAMLTVR